MRHHEGAIAFRYWLRNLFTDEDGAFSDTRWQVFAVIAGVAIGGVLMFACRNLPATAPQQVTVTVNDPGNAPVTVVVQP